MDMKEALVLKTESEIREARIEIVNSFLLSNGMNFITMTEDDKMSIYAMLVIKAEKFKKKHLDKCFEQCYNNCRK